MQYELFKFGVVGVSNTIVYWIVSTVVTKIFYDVFKKSYFLGNTVAFSVSVVWSFVWNKKFVFHDTSQGVDMWSSLFRTYITYSFTGIIIYNLLSWIWIDLIGFSYVVAPILNSIIGFPMNYLISKKWAFRKNEEANFYHNNNNLQQN